jgi:hypothetical protein
LWVKYIRDQLGGNCFLGKPGPFYKRATTRRRLVFVADMSQTCRRPVRTVSLTIVVAYDVVENVEALRQAWGRHTTFRWRQDCRSRLHVYMLSTLFLWNNFFRIIKHISIVFICILFMPNAIWGLSTCALNIRKKQNL